MTDPFDIWRAPGVKAAMDQLVDALRAGADRHGTPLRSLGVAFVVDTAPGEITSTAHTVGEDDPDTLEAMADAIVADEVPCGPFDWAH